MPRRSFVVRLPMEAKAWLDQELVKRGFAGYEEIAETLKAKGHQTSMQAVHRYGQRLQKQMEAISASTEAARIIANATPDQADARSAAVISMFQTGLFEAMLAMQAAEGAAPKERVQLYSKAARGIADLTRASVAQKKWADEVKAKLAAAKTQASKAAETVARKAGLSDDDWGAIRAQILGIEVEN